MKNILDKLYQSKDLTQRESTLLFDAVIQGKMSNIELTSLLIALKMKGEHPDEIAGAALALRKNANKFPVTPYSTADSCGTGGSGLNTVNISTMVAILLAEFGLPMVKHGNRSVSSKCGSADVLESLGVKIDMSAQQAKSCLDKTNFCFLFAPSYHPGVKHVMPVRKQLQTRTIFNLLGPLINPAQPEFQLMGVYLEELCLPVAQTLKLSGCQSAMVVHSSGYDEITLHSPTKIVELKDDQINQYHISNQDFDLPSCSPPDIEGNDPKYNTEIFIDTLKGRLDTSKKAAIANTVAANAGALLKISGHASTLAGGAKKALELILSGDSYTRLEAIVNQSKNISLEAENVE